MPRLTLTTRIAFSAGLFAFGWILASQLSFETLSMSAIYQGLYLAFALAFIGAVAVSLAAGAIAGIFTRIVSPKRLEAMLQAPSWKYWSAASLVVGIAIALLVRLLTNHSLARS